MSHSSKAAAEDNSQSPSPSLAREPRRAVVAEDEAGRLGVDARAPVVADGDAHSAVRRHVNAVETRLLGGDGGARRVDLEVFLVLVETREPDGGRAFGEAERDALLAQRDDAEDRVGADADEVVRVDLNLQTRVGAGGEHVALDERERSVCARSHSIVARALQADLAACMRLTRITRACSSYSSSSSSSAAEARAVVCAVSAAVRKRSDSRKDLRERMGRYAP